MVRLTAQGLRETKVPGGSVTMWWLGQAGFLIKSPAGRLIALDPYLSNSCKAIGAENGFDMDRLVPPPLAPSELVGIDLYALTHSHQDHFDPETVLPYRSSGGKGPFLAPAETIEKLHKLGIPGDQLNMIWPNKEYVAGDVTVRATFAIPFAGDDLTHVGYLIFIHNGPTVYFTGDTGYHDILAISVREHKPDIMVAVINGAFRNMGPAEAALLAKQLNPRVVIPCHHDLFRDNCQPPQMLRTNLRLLGIQDKYLLLEHGKPFTFP